ncbi:MAG: carboxypeptidase-like regulatory domain-containing protein [Muribaculaceae bacterium]|nr:carboxypeptidase-like regulatory domain-containing protein [Muribaculaceae bacterium]
MIRIRIITIIVAVITVLMVDAKTFSYRFNSTALPKAIQKFVEDHPDLDINFIYNELENYRTSTVVNTDNAYDALRQIVGLNPVTVTKSKNTYYVEALQHGKYVYNGRVIGSDNEPVTAATVMLLVPKDSTVLTYGITDEYGRFSIPCDRQGVLAKLTCLGYKPTFIKATSFSFGTINIHKLYIQLRQES